ncbi:Glutamate receptor ionotropic, delta-1-like 7, partial [Homarus americanus]
METAVVVETTVMFSQDQPTHEERHLLQGLWGDATLSCHVLILDNTARESHSIVSEDTQSGQLGDRFLERCRLWLRPETRVVVVGVKSGVETLLLHHALRNTNHALYLALLNLSRYVVTPDTNIRKRRPDEGSESVEVYRRCMYCNNGKEDAQLLYLWDLTIGVPSGLHFFYDQPENFMGRQFRIVTKSYFPYISTERESEEPGSTRVFLEDSLDSRMIHAMASYLNFTYDIREPLDRQWGLPAEGGNFTGLVGDLQYEKADFSLDLTVTTERASVVHFCRVYIDESVIILSLKPQPLPEYLSLIRPFVGELWLILLVGIFMWGVTLWLLQKVWSWASGGRSFTLTSALFYSWGVILEDPPADPPNNITA